MGDWIVSIAGTPEGARAATALALFSAFAHALFGAMQKGRFDPWLTRGAIDIWIFLLAAPVALFLVPWPRGEVWIYLIGALVIHFVYKVLVALAYDSADYTVVYPVIRGTGPLATVIFASIIFKEHFTALQWLGVICLTTGILMLALVNVGAAGQGRADMRRGIWVAVLGGLTVAAYTTWDALGIRAAANPFTFLAWFFFVTAIDMPTVAWLRYRRMATPPPLAPLLTKGLAGALVAFLSFGGVMLATRLAKVGEAAVLRETSIVFAALIGWLVLKETVGPRRLALMALIAAGAVIVEAGG